MISTAVTLIDKINHDLNVKGISNREIAQMLQVSHTTINACLSGEREFDFSLLSKILYILYEEDYEFRMQQLRLFCATTERKSNLRMAMEYAHLIGDEKFQLELIESEEKSSNWLNQQFAHIYKLLYQRSVNELSNEEYYEKVQKIKIPSINQNLKRLKIKNRKKNKSAKEVLAKVYAYFDLGNAKLVLEAIKPIIPILNKITNKFLKHTYNMRTKEMIASSLHKENLVQESREICFELIAMCNGVIKTETKVENNYFTFPKATAYGIIGETFILSKTTYKEALYNLKTGLEIIGDPYNHKMLSRKELFENTVDFLKLRCKIDLENIKPKNPEEACYLLIQLGRKQEAIQRINEMRSENNKPSGFLLYYLGLATGDSIWMEQSLLEFERNNNFFYAQLPKESLKQYNEERRD
ncbi:hypothetical protein FOA24_28095 [Bacillus thuringiensis]|uniref:AimR family lysis-lysogeny pheromone receptor n=1 Tax=Bacillus thuringiensis TaxID=1428 RepID=UPI00333A3B19